MSENETGPALLPCPFCGAGETVVHRNRGTWRGVRGYGEDVSVEVRHWCPPVAGQLTRGGITFVGRDLASAVAAWNRPRPVAPDARVCRVAATHPAGGSGAVPRAGDGPDVYRAGPADAPGNGAASGQGGCAPGGEAGVRGADFGGKR